MTEPTLDPELSDLPVRDAQVQSAATAPEQPLPVAPVVTETERVVRGILLSLLVVPVGVVAWVALWNAGFVASIVSFGVAFAATWLYRVGSRGARVTRGAFWALVGIIAATVVISFIAGMFTDLVGEAGQTFGEAIVSPALWSTFWNNVFTNPVLWQAYGPQFLVALLFAALGCFSTIRRLAREARR